MPGAGDHAPALERYLRDPESAGRALRGLRDADPATLPPAVLLAFADARARAGRRHHAARLFGALLDRGAGEPWTARAHLGLGRLALADGRLDEARPHYAAAAEAESQSRGFAALVAALLAAEAGRTAEAREALVPVMIDPGVTVDVRQAARLADAYVQLWAGRDADAASACAGLAAAADLRGLGDDARYCTAVAWQRAGEPERAEAILRTLAAEERDGRTEHTHADLVRLEPGAILRAGARRMGRARPGPPELQATVLLDADASVLARAALASPPVAARPTRPAEPGPPPPPGESPAAGVPAPPPVVSGGSGWLDLLALVLVAIVLLRRLSSRGGYSSPRDRRPRR